jgi:uncharacterized protein (TIGR03000 family)
MFQKLLSIRGLPFFAAAVLLILPDTCWAGSPVVASPAAAPVAGFRGPAPLTGFRAPAPVSGFRGSHVNYPGPYRFPANPSHPRYGPSSFDYHHPFFGYDSFYTPYLLIPNSTHPYPPSITGGYDFWYLEDIPPETPPVDNEQKAKTKSKDQERMERKPAPARAQVAVDVPTKAILWFDGKKTHTKGHHRKFHTPLLTPGQHFTYTLRARWKKDGKNITQTQKVRVWAGAHVEAAFPVPSGTDK